MKAYLMHPDQDFDPDRKPPPLNADLVQDLELATVLAAMAAGDKFLHDIATIALLASLQSPATITFRQDVLRDCLQHPDLVGQLYDLSVESLDGERKIFGGFFRSPKSILWRSVDALKFFTERLRTLRALADEHADGFASEGFTALFTTLKSELDDDYFDTVEQHLDQLKFRNGVPMSAGLGAGNRAGGYVLRVPRITGRGLKTRIFGDGRPGFTLTIAPRDEAGARLLGDIEDRGLNLVANALAQSTEHIKSFFIMLRAELGFYVGCLNLHERLQQKEHPTCFPQPIEATTVTLTGRAIYDPSLALTRDGVVVGNHLQADDMNLVVITGANQGGKSTFLRGLGLAQLMMQAGMFVAAEAFSANVCTGVFTHFRREEDATMTSGKLDEELRRMSGIADHLGRGCLVLSNESFASTNEREGSEIARQVIRGMLDAGVKVCAVTHRFDLADGFYSERRDRVLFLRAERRDDGQRTFRLVEAEPLPTSFGRDIYRRVFAPDPR